jgi:hypothetical protein
MSRMSKSVEIFIGGFVDKNLMRILEAENIRYNNTSEKGNIFLVQCIDPANTLNALQLSGEVFVHNVLRVSRSDIP